MKSLTTDADRRQRRHYTSFYFHVSNRDSRRREFEKVSLSGGK